MRPSTVIACLLPPALVTRARDEFDLVVEGSDMNTDAMIEATAKREAGGVLCRVLPWIAAPPSGGSQ